jgi:O-antigen/teichoic acid export membrane protein
LRINLFVLSKSVNELELGYFMAAWTLVETLYVFPEAVTGALFPAFSRIYGTAEEALGMVYSKMLKYILILSVAVCAGCLVVGDEILLLIYGPKFHDSIPILNVLIFLWAVGFLSNMMGWLLYAIKKETTHVKMMGAGCVVSLVLSIAFIEWFGTVGSAYALILSETFLVVSMAVVLHRSGLRSNLDGRLLRLALVVPAMVFAVRLMLDFNVVIQVMVGALVYAVSIYLFRVLDREELIALRRMIRR